MWLFFILCSRSITSQKKYCHTTQNTTLSGNNAMKFSTQVSKTHAATQGQDAADFDHEACFDQKLALRRFNNSFRTRHGLIFSKRAADAEGTCTLFYGKGKYSC